MHKKNLSFLFIFILCCFLSPSLTAQIQYENQVVEKINVIFNASSGTEVDSEAIISRLKTRKGDVFSQTVFDADLKTLAQDYDRVEPSFQTTEESISITIKVWPKPTIRTICWKGNERLSTKVLQKELDITSCSTFDRQAFNKAFHKLRGYYITKGFFEAELSYEIHYDPLTNEVDIEIEIAEGRAGHIKKIIFENFTCEEKEELLEMIVTKKYNLFTSFFSNEGLYNEEAVQYDQFTILNYLQNKGYADARVEIEVCEAKQKNRIIIKIIANKGEPFYFGKINFTGNSLFCDEDIQKLFTFSEGDLYSPDAIRETIQSITDYYGRRGYIDANVDFEPKLSEDCHAYDLSLELSEGEQYRVGLIKVFGNCSTKTSVILHETIIIPGEVFNVDLLKLTELKLLNIGYFEHVNVYAVKTEGSCSLGDNYRDVHIEVEETNTGKFGAFFGFSTVENMFGGLNLTENNFNSEGFGRIWQDGFGAIRGGGEFAHITATIGNKSRSYVLSWTKPFFMDTNWVVGFDLDNTTNRYISNDYTIDSSSINIHAGYQVNAFLNAGLHYRLTFADVKLSGDVKEKEHRERKAHEHGPSLVKESKNDGLISAIGGNLMYDSTDNPNRPSSGFKSRLEAELAGLGGEFKFIGAAYLNSLYFRVDRKGVLKFRWDFRFLFTYGDTHPSQLPLDERLYLGGDSIVRGYRAYKLGPQFIEKDPRGGLSMQLLSIEYTRSLMKRLDGFIFCDSGHLSFHEFHFGRLSTAIGAGVRFQVFENGPPLNFGMGYPINPRNRSEVKRFFLTIGGRF